MKENYKTFIIQSIQSIGGKQVSEQKIDDQASISFTIDLNNKKFNILMILGEVEDIAILQIFTTLPASYQEPDVGFYRILEKLNSNCIMGHIFFTKENDNYFISYKSNYICDVENFSANTSFVNFLTASIDMIGVFDNELNVM